MSEHINATALAVELDAKRVDDRLHPRHRYRLTPAGFLPHPEQHWVKTSMGRTRATDAERAAGVVLLPRESGTHYEARILDGPQDGDTRTPE